MPHAMWILCLQHTASRRHNLDASLGETHTAATPLLPMERFLAVHSASVCTWVLVGWGLCAGPVHHTGTKRAGKRSAEQVCSCFMVQTPLIFLQHNIILFWSLCPSSREHLDLIAHVCFLISLCSNLLDYLEPLYSKFNTFKFNLA